MAARKRAPLAVVLTDDAVTATDDTAGDQVPTVQAVPDQADETTAGTASETTAPAAPAKKTTRSPRKKRAAAPAAKKTTSSRTPAKKAAAKKAPAKPEPEPIRVLAADAKSAKKVSLYLHPDDARALGMGKLDDGVDVNSRIRAMVALWRENPRVRAQVDKLAKTAPRGGMI